MKFSHSVAFRGHQDPSLSSLLKAYFPELEMHTMQLYMVVEETAGPHIVANRRLEPVTTRCEFTLIQALENILGGDLTHYEIVGPGNWVTWNTYARDLKGQQLTLRYHSRPVPHTQLALYGPRSGLSETELKVPMALSQNILTDHSHNGQTYVKQPVSISDPTRMENLKYASLKSTTLSSRSDSNNEIASGSLESQKTPALSDSVIPGGPSHSFSNLTLETLNTRDCPFTQDSHTPVKVPISEENTEGTCHENKVLRDKVVYVRDSDTPDNNELVSQSEQPAPQSVMFNNVPVLSLLQPGFPSDVVSSPELQGKAASTLCEIKKNNLNTSRCSGTLTCGLPKDVQNVPFLPSSSDEETTPKAQAMSMEFLDRHDEHSMDSSLSIETVSINSLPSTNVSDSDQGQAASSLFTQSKNTQEINVMTVQAGLDYVPLTCIQAIGGQTPGVAQVDRVPSPCGSIRTPPSKRHRPSAVATTSAQQQLQSSHNMQLMRQYQKQQLLQHEQQQLQVVYRPNMPDISQPQVSQGPANTVSTVEYQILSSGLLSQQQQQLQQQRLVMETKTTGSPGAQPLNTHLSYPAWQSREAQSWSNSPREPTLAQLQNVHSGAQGMVPSQRSQQLSSSYGLQLSTQQSLICHTPTSPSLEADPHIRSVSEPVPIAMPQGKAPYALSQSCPSQKPQLPQPAYQNIKSVQSPHEKTTSPQYIEMTRHPAPDNRLYSYPPMSSPSMRTEQDIQSPASPQQPPLPPVEITVRLPNATSRPEQPNFVMQYPPSCAIPPISNWSSSSNGSDSGLVSSRPGINSSHRGSLPEATTHRKVQQPFSPAPPRMDPFGQQVAMSSWNPLSHISQSNSQGEGAHQPDSTSKSEEEDGYYDIDSRHVPRSVSLPANHWSSAPPRVNIQNELSRLDGWCPSENGDTIQKTMAKFQSQDGSYIIWKSRRYDQFVITVSHLNELIFLLVEEDKSPQGTIYYLYKEGFKSPSLLELVNHYRQDGIRMPITGASGSKKYNEHIRLRYPLRVQLAGKKTEGGGSKHR